MRSLALFLLAASLWAQSPKYGLGRAPSAEEVRQWDVSNGIRAWKILADGSVSNA